MYPIAFHPKYVHPVPPGHRFPMEKYELLPQQLLRQGIVEKEQFFEPVPVDLEPVYTIHNRSYVDRFVNNELDAKEARRIGFIQDKAIVARELLLVQGTIDGAKLALQNQIAFNIAGGTHHAFKSHGEGFCMLNDQGIAAQYLINNCGVKQVLIIDLDVHQGNGTADLFENEAQVFTFSMHCQDNYPFHKSISSLDVGLEVGTDDDVYLEQLIIQLKQIEQICKPDFIFYQSGVDILETDKMGKLKCTISGCKTRDQIVFQFAKRLGVPVQCSMGGGYSANIADILDAHTNTFIAANEVFY